MAIKIIYFIHHIFSGMKNYKLLSIINLILLIYLTKQINLYDLDVNI